MSNIPDFKQEAHELFDEMVQVRRDFHRYPELGFHETRTSNIVAEKLGELGYEVQRGIGQTGVVGLLDGPTEGPVIMLRFDMDALPIQEENNVSYISKNDGVMHACGHDGHMSMGLALAKIMAKHRDKIKGTLKFVFQPAEEGLGGAFAMISDGVLENPRPDYAFAMHLWTPEPYGNVRIVEGPTMSSSSVFTLTVQGVGGHGAAPHLATDPVLAAAHIVSALQSITSRNIDPQESVVLSIGQFTAGTTFNVIPDKALLKGTVRSYNNELHRLVYRRILEMATQMATAFNCKVTMETIAIVQAVVNSPEPTAIVHDAAVKIFGEDKINPRRTMASEDMGFFLDEIPGCYFFIGARNEEKGYTYPHHHPKFDFDERSMINGVSLMAETVSHYVMNGYVK
ncbi:MAG: amidohydrolase [Chloroflexota bacterium]